MSIDDAQPSIEEKAASTARTSDTYLARLEFIIERQRVFDVAPYDVPFSRWTRQMKAALTQEYNRARLATSTSEVADQRNYREMLKIIRPFSDAFSAKAGYRMDDIEGLTRAQKSKLTKYFKKGVELASKQFELYHSNDKESMTAMAKLANQKGYPEFNQIFYPAPPGTHIHYNKKTGNVVAVGLRSTITAYYWDQFGITPDQLAADPRGVTLKLIEMTGNGKRRFSIKAGEYNIGQGVPLLWTKNYVANNVANLVEKYGADKEDADDPNSHYFGNWLTGIEAWDFETRADEQHFVNATRAESIERKRYKRALRRKIRDRATPKRKKRGK